MSSRSKGKRRSAHRIRIDSTGESFFQFSQRLDIRSKNSMSFSRKCFSQKRNVSQNLEEKQLPSPSLLLNSPRSNGKISYRRFETLYNHLVTYSRFLTKNLFPKKSICHQLSKNLLQFKKLSTQKELIKKSSSISINFSQNSDKNKYNATGRLPGIKTTYEKCYLLHNSYVRCHWYDNLFLLFPKRRSNLGLH